MSLLMKERTALNTALEIARSSQNPADAAKNMPHLAQLLAAVQPAWERTSDVAQRIIMCQFTSGVIVSSTGAITNSNVQPIQFPSPGKVVGVKGIVVEGESTPGLFQNYISASVQINGDRYLVTDGQVQRFVPLSCLGGKAVGEGGWSNGWFPLDNYVLPSDRWFCQASATASTVPQGTYTPLFMFLFEADFDALRLG